GKAHGCDCVLASRVPKHRFCRVLECSKSVCRKCAVYTALAPVFVSVCGSFNAYRNLI
uniref:Uncharacterized protein n=1 Tax=Anopheles arabiensis TaxID=7173 RepID=A0A182IH73_ANOAR